MESTVISWNVPNIITIWLMLALGFLLLTLAIQFSPWGGGSTQNAAGAGGY
jgi:hypothetical protein